MEAAGEGELPRAGAALGIPARPAGIHAGLSRPRATAFLLHDLNGALAGDSTSAWVQAPPTTWSQTLARACSATPRAACPT